jgi:predicted outer membrane protein
MEAATAATKLQPIGGEHMYSLTECRRPAASAGWPRPADRPEPYFVFACKPIDPQIVGIVVAANQIDIDYGHLALARTHNKQVHDFAQQMACFQCGFSH